MLAAWIFGFAVIVCLLVLADGVFAIAKAVASLENTIRQTADEFRPKSENERTLEWMEETGFGDAAVKRDVS